ncbi:Unannotated [Lentimonas sp. CC4]|nr:Unannotated [Lentimonas sp. CC4]CAA6683443.1 Unannotated [Lentimonas sp. CC6]CAA7078081.1 Unannotated [Lentimonas sp. CC4]CAA7171623.1 Unannotated [Lentimonas sp. CC21]CAA7181409.1 Unannotated [Lentimonas sp. CC8]
MLYFKLLPCAAYPSTHICLVNISLSINSFKLLPCEGEVAPSAGSEGFSRLFKPSGQQSCFGSAKNPSV